MSIYGFDESSIRRGAGGRFAPKSYGDPGQLSLEEDPVDRTLDELSMALYGHRLELESSHDPAWGEGVVRTITPSGTAEYKRNGVYHREDGPAIETASGTKAWYRDGLQHREDGPAVEASDGSRQWARNGLPHRLDGPAIVRAGGSEVYAIDGE